MPVAGGLSHLVRPRGNGSHSKKWDGGVRGDRLELDGRFVVGDVLVGGRGQQGRARSLSLSLSVSLFLSLHIYKYIIQIKIYINVL